ncbi:MAG: hypothetical protein WC632_04160 [Candidatus Margulisiibacteriota bacterium]
MWQLWGTLACAAFGGSIFLHYLKNFLLKEEATLTFDWDGVIERALIAYCFATGRWLWAVPLIIIVKIIYRLALLGFSSRWLRSNEPGAVSQKVNLKTELALDLFLSPLFAIVVGVVF